MSKVGSIVVAVIVAGTFWGVYHNNKQIKKLRTDVETLDSGRYIEACKRLDAQLISYPSTPEDFTHNTYKEIDFWENEYKTAVDSIDSIRQAKSARQKALIEKMRIDGLSKKAYLLGAQNVRDSLNLINSPLMADKNYKQAYYNGVKMVRDSIKNAQNVNKMENFAKKAYNKGARMIRDSLKAASKLK